MRSGWRGRAQAVILRGSCIRAMNRLGETQPSHAAVARSKILRHLPGQLIPLNQDFHHRTELLTKIEAFPVFRSNKATRHNISKDTFDNRLAREMGTRYY